LLPKTNTTWSIENRSKPNIENYFKATAMVLWLIVRCLAGIWQANIWMNRLGKADSNHRKQAGGRNKCSLKYTIMGLIFRVLTKV
jgi:hypothetical protein